MRVCRAWKLDIKHTVHSVMISFITLQFIIPASLLEKGDTAYQCMITFRSGSGFSETNSLLFLEVQSVLLPLVLKFLTGQPTSSFGLSSDEVSSAEVCLAVNSWVILILCVQSDVDNAMAKRATFL